MERERELKQDGAKFASLAQHVEAGAGFALFFGGCVGVMSESLPKLCSEHELRVPRNSFDPLPAMFRLQRLIKRSVDFDGAEVFGKVCGLVEAARPGRRVDDALPILVRPSGRADVKVRHG